MIKENYIYKDQNNEYFVAEYAQNGQLVLKNPSYPFSFLPTVLGELEEVGPREDFKNLVTKQNYTFHKGDTLTVSVSDQGLEVESNLTDKQE